MFTESTRDTPDVFFPSARAAQRNKYVINTSGPRDWVESPAYTCGSPVSPRMIIILLRAALFFDSDISTILLTSGSPFGLWINPILLTSGSPFRLWINPILLTSGSLFGL